MTRIGESRCLEEIDQLPGRDSCWCRLICGDSVDPFKDTCNTESKTHRIVWLYVKRSHIRAHKGDKILPSNNNNIAGTNLQSQNTTPRNSMRRNQV